MTRMEWRCDAVSRVVEADGATNLLDFEMSAPVREWLADLEISHPPAVRSGDQS